MQPRATVLIALVALSVLAVAQGAGVAASIPNAAFPDCDDAIAVSLGGSLPAYPVDHPTLNPCPGIRPGGALVLRVGPYQFGPAPFQMDFVYCSMSFIVTDGADLYVATAGHCVDRATSGFDVGDRQQALGVPGTFGTVVYKWCEGQAANGGCGAGRDFGLIRIDADKRAYVNAAMCHWGAPTGGLFTEFDREMRSIEHFGWGIGLGDPTGGVGFPVGNPATQARRGLTLDATNETFVLVETAAISGDSGSGVLVAPLDLSPLARADAPQALGVLTHISVGGIAIVQRLDASLERAGDALGKTFTVVDAV